MKVFIERSKQEKELKFEGTVQELLLYLHINPETVLVSRNDELITESDVVSPVDTVKILSVVSGG